MVRYGAIKMTGIIIIIIIIIITIITLLLLLLLLQLLLLLLLLLLWWWWFRHQDALHDLSLQHTVVYRAPVPLVASACWVSSNSWRFCTIIIHIAALIIILLCWPAGFLCHNHQSTTYMKVLKWCSVSVEGHSVVWCLHRTHSNLPPLLRRPPPVTPAAFLYPSSCTQQGQVAVSAAWRSDLTFMITLLSHQRNYICGYIYNYKHIPHHSNKTTHGI